MQRLITVSGVTGAGKTSLAESLGARMGHALVLKFDDFDHLMVWDEDYAGWLARGANFEEFDLSKMREHVEKITIGSDLVIFDYPHGRLNRAFRDAIDFSIYVDTPLDIALARRILRDNPSKEALETDLRAYLDIGRGAFLTHGEQIKPTADLIIDGSQTLATLTAVAQRAIEAHQF
jgi:uridine kinase